LNYSTATRLKELLAPLERPVIRDGKRSRALRPFDDPDRLCWKPSVGESNQCLSQPRFARTANASAAPSVKESCRRSGVISRKLRLLRDAGLMQKIQKSYRYKVTIKGRSILTTLIASPMPR
jgi:hypothetical protein